MWQLGDDAAMKENQMSLLGLRFSRIETCSEGWKQLRDSVTMQTHHIIGNLSFLMTYKEAVNADADHVIGCPAARRTVMNFPSPLLMTKTSGHRKLIVYL